MDWIAFDEESGYLDRFGLLLVVAILAVVTLSLVDLRQIGQSFASEMALLTVSVFVGATMMLALRASGVKRRYRIWADIIVVTGVVASTILVLVGLFAEVPDPATTGRPAFVWIVLSLAAPILVIRRLFSHHRATSKTLLGAVSAYLLIALAFNFIYLALDAFGARFFETEEPTTNFMYFSLVTITTLGYGDLSAAEPLGRLLSTLEAVIGQVYLVTFVAMIVGLMVGEREKRLAG